MKGRRLGRRDLRGTPLADELLDRRHYVSVVFLSFGDALPASPSMVLACACRSHAAPTAPTGTATPRTTGSMARFHPSRHDVPRQVLTRMPTHSHRPLPKLPCGGLQEVRPDGAGTNSKNTHVFTGGQNESGVRWARNPHVERLPGPDPARPTRVELVRTGQARTTWFAEDRISGSRRGPGPPAGSPRPSPYRASGSRSRRSRSSGRARPWPARWARPRRCGSGAAPYRPG